MVVASGSVPRRRSWFLGWIAEWFAVRRRVPRFECKQKIGARRPGPLSAASGHGTYGHRQPGLLRL